jgi:hypothetical protein
MKISYAVLGAALVALSAASTANASERHHIRRHVQQPHHLGSTADPRDSFAYYYPGWGRDRAPTYGVYPGLIYGGATSAPAGH